MKALSLHQPWASMVACGLKTIETRGKRTNHRGPLLIVASKSVVPWQMYWDHMAAANPNDAKLVDDLQDKMNSRLLPRGVAVAIVEVVGCRRMVRSDERGACCRLYPGAWAWVTDPRKLIKVVDQIPVRGWPGMFEGPDFYTGRLTI